MIIEIKEIYMNNVAVLLSTYNGEKYLRELLDSVFNQKDVNLTLFVRDDGSSDKTVQILEKYKKKGFPIDIYFVGGGI